MADPYKSLYRGGQDEISIKKSRFIGTARPVSSEEEAVSFITEMKKKYWDASHNCSAYVIGERFRIQRMSDDGEPSGTAGKPMLDILLGEEIHDTAIVVTRYFGGTLLGTGGLVRAYSEAAKAALGASTIISKYSGAKLKVTTDYSDLGKIQYLLAQRKIEVTDSSYEANVIMGALVPSAVREELAAELTDATNARVVLEWGEDCRYAEIDGEYVIFE